MTDREWVVLMAFTFITPAVIVLTLYVIDAWLGL